VSSVLVALLFALAIPAAAAYAGGGGVMVDVVAETTAIFDRSTSASRLIIFSTIFGVCLSAIGQVGDLFESCLKRDAVLKTPA